MIILSLSISLTSMPQTLTLFRYCFFLPVLLLLLSCLPSDLLQTISSCFKFNFSSIPSRNRTHPGEDGTYCGTGHVRAHRMFKGSNTNGTAVEENYYSVLCVTTLLLDSTHTVVCVLGGEKDRTVSTLENDLTLNYLREEEMKFIFSSKNVKIFYS